MNSKIFRFEPKWLREESFKDIVREAWISAEQNESSLYGRLSECAERLQAWNEKHFGKVHKRIKFLKNQIESLGKQERTEGVVDNENKLSAELDEWLAREELL